MPLPSDNLLASETSPYLRQHADNPVHWRPWSTSSLLEAQELDRPILLSVGYAACHWCHVMAHESFENADIAAVMNRHFTNIKVDREERPDIDQIYMAALSSMGEQGGWPLTMFLTPDGRPFWGGTYFPPTTRYGRPGFVDVLESVARAWRERRHEIDQSATGLADHVRSRLAASTDPGPLTADTLSTLASGLYGLVDHRLGGIRGAPKFPNAPFMETLWLSWLRDGNEGHRDAVLLSLRRMLDGGIYDHVGGGLSRYSTDGDWLVPHFEKMLYDNAQLLRLAGWAYAETGDQLFRFGIEETVDWLLREMVVDGGGFASSLDADSEGEEGLFYTWDLLEIDTVLGPDAAAFHRIYTLGKPHAWEGKPIIHIAPSTLVTDDERQQAAQLRSRLLAARGKRVRPGRDDKVLTDWNALMIAALADVGRQFERPAWIVAAQSAYRFVSESTGDQAQLPHSRLGKASLFPAISSDLAAMISAAIALYAATGAKAYLDDAVAWAGQLDRRYASEGSTGYFLTASDATDVPMRIRGDTDEAIPSATSQVVGALFRLASVTGSAERHAKAWAAAEDATGRAVGMQYGQAGIVNACAAGMAGLKLVTIDADGTDTYAAVAAKSPDPRRVDVRLAVGSTSDAIGGGVVPDTNRPGAYLCTANACLPPIHDPEKLAAALRRPPF